MHKHSASSLTLLLAQMLAALTCAAAGEFEHARWIAPPTGVAAGRPCPIFRKEFVLDRQPRRASLRIVGLGDFDARINGRRLADTGMNQPWSQYEKTIYYREFDISGLLTKGTNCVGVMLGNSFWNNPNPPKGRYNKHGPQRTVDEPYLLYAEIRCEGARGSGAVGTDETWRTADGPVTFSHIYAGEDYDARAELKGWDRPGFDDRAWQAARVTAAPRASWSQ